MGCHLSTPLIIIYTGGFFVLGIILPMLLSSGLEKLFVGYLSVESARQLRSWSFFALFMAVSCIFSSSNAAKNPLGYTFELLKAVGFYGAIHLIVRLCVKSPWVGDIVIFLIIVIISFAFSH